MIESFREVHVIFLLNKKYPLPEKPLRFVGVNDTCRTSLMFIFGHITHIIIWCKYKGK
jgi:hypothetical protein